MFLFSFSWLPAQPVQWSSCLESLVVFPAEEDKRDKRKVWRGENTVQLFSDTNSRKCPEKWSVCFSHLKNIAGDCLALICSQQQENVHNVHDFWKSTSSFGMFYLYYTSSLSWDRLFFFLICFICVLEKHILWPRSFCILTWVHSDILWTFYSGAGRRASAKMFRAIDSGISVQTYSTAPLENVIIVYIRVIPLLSSEHIGSTMSFV